MGRLRLSYLIRQTLWAIPLVCVLAGIGLSFVTVAIDRANPGLVPEALVGTPSAAQAILSTVAQATITLITIVLTVTTVAVQLAMGQFSPRIVRTLLHDRFSQFSHGVFGATFAFAILAIRQIDDETPGGDAAWGVTILTTYVLVLASVIVLILYVNHAARELTVTGLIDLVGDDLRVQLDRVYPPDETSAAGAPQAQDGDPGMILCPEQGVLVDVDRGALVALAREADCTLELVPAVGDFVCGGAPLFRVRGDPTRVDHAGATGCVVLGAERTHDNDPAYGFRKLVDIAERSVSDPFDDPTTTVQAIDRLHDCLRHLSTRPFPNGRCADDDDRVRLVMQEMTWEAYVRLAFDELRLAGAGSPQVARRLSAALEDLRAVAPPERRAPLERQLTLLRTAVARGFVADDDVEAALTPDAQGIGSGRDLSDEAPPATTDGDHGDRGARGAAAR